MTIMPPDQARHSPEVAAPWEAVGSRLARSIVVVSAVSGGICHGMTADSFTMVSRDPALVMVAVTAYGRTHRVLAGAAGFAVSVLAGGQAAVAAHFASRRRPAGLRQFAAVDWEQAPHSAAPVLADALVWLDCARRDVVPAGDHVLVLGEVLRVSPNAGSGQPLIRFGGRYRALTEGPD